MIQSLYFKSLGRLFCEKIDHHRIFEIVYFLRFFRWPPLPPPYVFFSCFFLFGPLSQPPPPPFWLASKYKYCLRLVSRKNCRCDILWREAIFKWGCQSVSSSAKFFRKFQKCRLLRSCFSSHHPYFAIMLHYWFFVSPSNIYHPGNMFVTQYITKQMYNKVYRLRNYMSQFVKIFILVNNYGQ